MRSRPVWRSRANPLFLLLLAAILIGCAETNPVYPDRPSHETDPYSTVAALTQRADSGPYRLWGQWRWFISEDHSEIEIVPLRAGDFHFNALKFLEGGPCYDCLTIDSISPGSEPGTVDIEVTIRHPFPSDNLVYTGFDVKGILMFSSSYHCHTSGGQGNYPPDGEPARISWREYGDPEVLNPDGYSYRWSPSYDSGSSQPILNYWPGNYALGEPDAHINAHMNYYTHENRHMFYPGYEVTRTYSVWLPPGPITSGYAVEACWEPPLVDPVNDPANDFPITANQPEPYLFTYEWNNGEPVTEDAPACCGWTSDCNDQSIQIERWYGDDVIYTTIQMENFGYGSGWPVSGIPCDDPLDGYRGMGLDPSWFNDGQYRWLVHAYNPAFFGVNKYNLVFTMIDFEIDLD